MRKPTFRVVQIWKNTTLTFPKAKGRFWQYIQPYQGPKVHPFSYLHHLQFRVDRQILVTTNQMSSFLGMMSMLLGQIVSSFCYAIF